jgi:maltose-binding protein MalE
MEEEQRLKAYGKLLLVIFTVFMIAGCGKEKPDVSIFMMDDQSDPAGVSEQLEKTLQDKLGPDLKVQVIGSPLYNLEKLMVEYAAGGNDIILLPEGDMKNYGKMGAHTPLDDYFDPKKYPSGVFASKEVKDDKTVDNTEHLYGIPVKDMKVFQDLKYTPDKLFVTIPVSAKHVDNAVKAIKALTE